MRALICGISLFVLAAGSAAAENAPSATTRGVDAVSKAPRAVFVCDTSAMTRRAFVREYGAIEFVKAETAIAKGEAWATPKCVTGAEARRLKQLASLR